MSPYTVVRTGNRWEVVTPATETAHSSWPSREIAHECARDLNSMYVRQRRLGEKKTVSKSLKPKLRIIK